MEYNFEDNIGFSNELGESQCVTTEEVEWISYFICEQWLVPGETCIYWTQVQEQDCPPEGCDLIKVDTILHGFLDVDQCCDPATGECVQGIDESECSALFGGTGEWQAGCISISDGSLQVKHCLCGDLNEDGTFSILDIVTIINYLYKNGPAPLAPIIVTDTNGDDDINILDIVCLINSKYKSGNCCDNPPWMN